MTKRVGIYLITNKINGKRYIGQSRHLIKRWNQHKSESRKDAPLCIVDKAMKKYGIENFDFNIILECEIDMLDKWETDMINLYDCVIPKGYNVNPTGRGLSDSTRIFLSNRMKNNNPMKNPEVINKVRERLTGTHHNRVTDYQKRVTSERMKSNNPMKNPEVVKKVLKTKKEREKEIVTKEYVMAHSKWKNIYQFSSYGQFIKKWYLISDIEKELHIDHCCIYACLNGKQKTAGGYIWRCI